MRRLRLVATDLQDGLNLGRDVGLLVQLDALLVGPGRALRGDPLQVGQHHAVSLGHCLELVKQKLQQLQQQPAEGSRERVLDKSVRSPSNSCPLESLVFFCLADTQGYFRPRPCARLVEKVANGPLLDLNE